MVLLMVAGESAVRSFRDHFAVELSGSHDESSSCIQPSGILEDGVNRRRILSAIISVTVLILVALFLPSLHRTPPPPSIAPPAGPVPISPAPTAPASAEQTPVLPSAPLTTEASPLPPPQTSNGLQDVDPHKAFGSK